MVPQIDTLLGGKYRIVRILGEGGMGSVYEVEHALTQKRAAIKRVHPHLLAHDRGHRRVLQEARAAARVSHRNVVDVYDVISEGDSICLVMELLEGEPLSAWIERGGHPLHEFVALLLPAMQGVAAAHAAGVVHRDVKPENIFLVDEAGAAHPTPKVIDFGISKLVDPDGQATHSGVTMGTPRYVSYEQLVGAIDIDGRADVYAFGVMLYEALTGRTPYNANTFSQQAICFATMKPTRPRDLVKQVPEALEQVALRAIARDRDARFASLLAFHDALAPFARAESFATPLLAFPRTSAATAPFGTDGTIGGAPPLSTLRSVAPLAPLVVAHAEPSPRRRTGMALSVGAVCLLALLALVAWWTREDQPPTLASRADFVAGPATPAVKAAPPPNVASTPTASAPPATPLREPDEAPARPGTLPLTRKKTKGSATPKPEAQAPAASATSPAAAAVSTAPPETHRAGRLSDDQF